LIGGFLIEAIGVNTGLIFGRYQYSGVLGVGLFDTPFLIGFNWVMLIYMSWIVVKDWPMKNWVKIMLASLIMVLYDIVLEPFAIHFNMWNWVSDVPPIQNYAAWFIISMLFFAVVSKSKIEMENLIARPLLLIQFGFFLILNITIML
jgi:putative membrane protein